MWRRWSHRRILLLFVALASSGCHGTSTKGDARPPARQDAGRDFSFGDLSAEPRGDDAALDFGTDPGLDIDSGELGLDVSSDGVAARPHDLGTGVRDAGLELLPDFDADPRDLGDDTAADLPVELERDLGADSPLHPDADAPLDANAWPCPSGQPRVLVLSGNNQGGLYWFHPDTLALGRMGTVSCGTSELNSLAVSPVGPAYVSNVGGELCVVDLATRMASPTSFDAGSISNQQYGMALGSDPVATGETLYIAVRSAGRADTLARVDLSTFTLTTIGPIEIHQDGGTEPCSGIELTPSAQGGLYGFGVGAAPALLLAIDPKTGNAVKLAEVPVANPGGFAIVEWQGTIYLFFAESGVPGSAVFTFRTGDTHVSRRGSIDTAVIGAGVAVCP